MTVTADMVYQWESQKGWQLVKSFKHGFGKLPVIYCYRPKAYCEKIKTLRVRLENFCPIMPTASITTSSPSLCFSATWRISAASSRAVSSS